MFQNFYNFFFLFSGKLDASVIFDSHTWAQKSAECNNAEVEAKKTDG